MKILLLSCLLVGALVQGSYSAIVATKDDFNVDCGTDVGGPISVVYTNPDPTNNKVLKLISQNKDDTCVGTNVSNVFTISDARTKCQIVKPNANKAEYWLQVALQEVNGIYMDSDPKFLFRCSYSVKNITITTTKINDIGPGATPTSVTLESKGNPDMTYKLEFIDTSQQVLSEVKMGDSVLLRALMNGTDEDEQGVQVQSCTAISGSVNRTFIDNFCIVPGLEALFPQSPGFISNGQQAFFPMTVFALEGSNSADFQVECVITVCPSVCDGPNCPTAGRRKRAAGEENNEEKSLRLATKIEILPIAVPNQLNQSSQQETSPTTCMQSLGFIVTVAVLSVLLLVAMATVVFMFTTRRREIQKQGA